MWGIASPLQPSTAFGPYATMMFGTDIMYGLSTGNAIFYTNRNGNWNDLTIWETLTENGRGRFPQIGDDVYIRHNVVMNLTATTVNNLSINAGATLRWTSAFNFTVNGNLKVDGTFDMGGFANNITLIGNDNYINSFINPSTSTITYSRLGNQSIMPLSYHNLTIAGAGIKKLSQNTVLAGNLNMNPATVFFPILDATGYDLTVTGTTAIGVAILRKLDGGTILLTGNVTANSNSTTWDMSGNPTVEFRGGITYGGAGNTIWIGNPSIVFSTNNQTISVGNVFSSNTYGTANITISGAITVTVSSTGAVTNSIVIAGVLNGDNAGSTFDNRATVRYRNATAPMVTGVLTTNAAVNTWIEDIGAQDLKGGTYSSLTLSGGAVVKKLLGNISVTATYTLTAPTTLNSNGFALTNP